MLIHAASKVGKSTLTSTAPTPHLVLDAEGSWKFIRTAGFKSNIPLRHKRWDPIREPAPVHDGSWDVCIVSVRDWSTMQHTYQALTQQPHNFKSLTIDSITEVQRRCKKNLKGSSAMQIQDWGVLLDEMDNLIRSFRDLTLDPTNPISCVMLVCETKMINGKWRPYMQGQIASTLPYWLDVVGYLYTMFTEDGNGQATIPRKVLHVGPSDYWESGERVQGLLPDAILDPNITTILNTVYPA